MLLAPIEICPLAYFESDLVTIQRYTGKTNEQFTHLMLNLGVGASTAAAERVAEGRQVRVFDPVAGRGTTLNRALLAGYDVTGVELSASDVEQYRSFIVTYLRSHRVKHRLEREQIRKGPLAGTQRFIVHIGRSRGEGRQQRVELVNGDTTRTAAMFPARSFDVLVADLPYGVQHRSTTGADAVAGRRTPDELLADSLAGWRTVLRGGASITLSWNIRTLARADVHALLIEHDFEVIDHPRSFEHVVDRSITRDLIVARK
jgi:tRNA G10  N-methylase Trm11